MSSKFNLKGLPKTAAKLIVRDPTINSFGAKVISPWFPAPFKQDFMELKYGVWDGISSRFSEDGRQLGEGNTGPGLWQQRLPTDYQIARHAGSRKGLTMNLTAFRIVMQHWNEAISILLACRELLIAKSDFSSPLSALQLLIFSKQVVALPAYMVRANEQEIDSVVSTAFQITAGVFMIIEKMIEEAESWLDPTTRKTAEELFEYADQKGVLISNHGHVCGGSQAKIIEMLDLIIHGPGDDSKYTDGTDALKQRAIDCDTYFAYAMHSEKLEKLLSIAQIVSDIRSNKHSEQDYIRLRLFSEVVKEIDQIPCCASTDFSLDDVLPKADESISSSLDDRLQTEVIRQQELIQKSLGFEDKPIPESILNKALGK